MIPTLLLLLGCQLAGEILSRGLHLPLPGAVLGMILMLGLMLALPRRVDGMRPVIVVLLANLSLMYIPAGTGLIAFVAELKRDGLALAVLLVASTAASLIVGAWTFGAVARLTGNRGVE
ncbi:CidA/LrgA family protein [Falsirhodobacter sp. 20TX0035]|uniref:CidA/LrgA family protein n=1 Tax=Falsirhodobacter sp. 20TX0035 TaxID=3022019 RepID=UPI0023305C98|nr:CidA/LrgA family protein [Falsirhodobacter sp. 20TX0035]MDB6455174.1 CidA/LrgA family protein [Falsirhodobacter sp. 20TX0035]